MEEIPTRQRLGRTYPMHAMGGSRWRAWVLGGLSKWVPGTRHCPESYRTPSERRLDLLPDQFQTPMFWNTDDLEELRGTSIFGQCVFSNSLLSVITCIVLDKIGRAEAEKDYHEKLMPALKVNFLYFSCFSDVTNNVRAVQICFRWRL
jgi:hypothetical protein